MEAARQRKSGVLFISDASNVGEFRDKWLQIFSELKLAANLEVASTEGEGDRVNQAAFLKKREKKRTPQPSSTPQITIESLIGLPVKLPEELLKELAVTCGTETLHCEGEALIYEYASKRVAGSRHVLHNVPKDVDLVTLKVQEEDLTRRWTNASYRGVLNRHSKHVNLDQKFPQMNLDEKTDCIEPSVDVTEVLLSVMVCRPSRTYVKSSMIRGGIKFNVLGSQKLTELRDRIACIADIMVPGDFSFNPKVPVDIRAKDLYKSGFFFINGVFYNDMRDLTSRDYSKIIMDWAQNPSRKMGPFQSKKMEDTRFVDVDIQLGYPYVYVHQGDCEHLIVFTDLRMVSGSDCLDKNQYPICCWLRRKRRTTCMVCHSNTSKWVVQKSSRLPTDPFFFCDFCFNSFNYDSQGKKIGEFIAQPYLDKVATL